RGPGADHRDAGARGHARDLAAGLERVQRTAGRPAKTAVLVRAPLQLRQHHSRAGAVPAEFPALPLAGAPLRDGRGERDLRRYRRARRMAVRPGRPVVPAAAPKMPQPLATPEEAAAYPYTPGKRQFARERFASQAVGSPETVR